MTPPAYLSIAVLLDGILPLFELDSYADPLIMMAAVDGDELDPSVETDYMAAIRTTTPTAPEPVRIDRMAFYERARNAYACVVTGTLAKYGNLILKKGVIPV